MLQLNHHLQQLLVFQLHLLLPLMHDALMVVKDVIEKPPPATIAGFSITSFTTINASCIDLSTSSTTLCEPPLSKRETDFGFLHPSTNTHLSDSTFFC